MKIPFLNHNRKKNGNQKSLLSFFQLGKDSSRDWKILLSLFMIFFLAALVFFVYFFFGIVQGDFFRVSQNQEVKPRSFDRVFIKEVITDFANREKIFEELKKNRINISDPMK